MNPLDLLKSSDIEMVQLACNLLLESKNFIEIEDLVNSNSRFIVDTFDRNYITLRKRGGLYEQMKGGNWNTYKPSFNREDVIKVMEGLYKNNWDESNRSNK